MLERLLPNGQTEAGIYAQAFRISDALSMFAFLFASILLPLFAKMLKEKEPVNKTLSHSFALLMIPSAAVIVSVIFISYQVMALLYQQHAEKSAEILNYLLIGFAGIGLTYIFGTLLTAAGKLRILNITAFLGVILNVLLNIYLIPISGAKGAAISSMITQVLMGIVQVIISLIIFKIRIRIITLTRYSILIVILIFSSFLWNLADLPWFYSLITIPVLGMILGISFKLIKMKNFGFMLK